MTFNKLTAVCSLCLLISAIGFSQYTEVINSNRPGISRGAFSVGTNVVQFETGPFIINEKHALLNQEADGFGFDFAARYGLFFEELEVNLEGSYQNDTFKDNTHGTEQNRSYFSQLTFGAKYLVYDPYKDPDHDKPNLYSWKANQGFKWKSLIPAVSVYAGVNYDSKSNPYIAPGVDGMSAKIIVATQHHFSQGWVFVMNLIRDRIGTDDSGLEFLATVTHSFNSKWALFAEYHGIDTNYYADNLFRTGGAYLWSKDFQIDAGVTFNAKDTPSVFKLNLGFSYRFDFHQDKINPDELETQF